MPNWLAASQGVETPPVEMNAVSGHGNTSSANTSTPIQEISAISAETIANWPQAYWTEAQPVGPNPITTTENGGTSTVANWEQIERRECVPANVAALDVALPDAEVATEGRVVPVDVELSQEDAAEWFWTIRAQFGYERW